MKILITGGCGFLGSNIAASFLKEGNDVVVIDGLFRKGGEKNLEWLKEQGSAASFRFFNGDLANQELVENVFKSEGPFDYVCHLGGQVAMTTSLSDPRRDLKTNVLGTFNLLESIRAYSPSAFLAYSSTNKVYGDLEWMKIVENEKRFTIPEYPNGLDERIPLDFASPYGCSKGAADQYVRDWYRNFGIKTVVFRHSSIYGGRQFSTFDQGWIGWFCQKGLEQQKALNNQQSIEPFTISGTGKQVRDVLHADDLVRLYRLAFENRESIAGEIFNIGGGMENSLSLLELFDLIQDLLGMKTNLQFERLPRRQSDQDFFVADISKAKQKFGWSPRVSSLEGIEKMLDWTRQNFS